MKTQLTITYSMDTSEDGKTVTVYDKQRDLEITLTDYESITEWGRLLATVRALPISSWKTEGGKLLGEFFNRHFYGGTK